MKKLWMGVIGVVFCGVSLAGPVDHEVEKILDPYFKIQSALTQDTTTGVDAAAGEIVTLASSVQVDDAQVQSLFDAVRQAAERIQGQDLKSTRSEFFELSKPLMAYLNQHYSGQNEFFRFFCGMAKKGWIQSKDEVRNPYMGSSMLKCGEPIR